MYVEVAGFFGDLLVGFLSTILKSCKHSLYIYFILAIGGIILYFAQDGGSVQRFLLDMPHPSIQHRLFCLDCNDSGRAKFGTNLRATVATAAPNMVRGSLPLMMLLFPGLGHIPHYLRGCGHHRSDCDELIVYCGNLVGRDVWERSGLCRELNLAK